MQMHIDEAIGVGTVALYATPNPFLLNKICLNQIHIGIQLDIQQSIDLPYFTLVT